MRRTETIAKIKSTVHAGDPTATVILYGSQARDEARDDSDIDVLILVDGDHISYRDKVKIMDPLFDLEIDERVPISPMVYTKSECYNRPIRSPFYMNVNREGIVL